MTARHDTEALEAAQRILRELNTAHQERRFLREALEVIANGDEPRPIGEHWREDGKPSKHDKCTHGRWMYEDCGECISEFARKALGEQP